MSVEVKSHFDLEVSERHLKDTWNTSSMAYHKYEDTRQRRPKVPLRGPKILPKWKSEGSSDTPKMGVEVESQLGSPGARFFDGFGRVFLESKRVKTQPRQHFLGILVLCSVALYNEVFSD